MISQSKYYHAYAFCPIPIDGVRNDVKFKKALNKLESYFNELNLPFMLGRGEEARLEELRMAYGNRMEVEYLDEASDYIYKASDLINLSGKKFSSKRNHINKFLRLYGSYEYVPIDKSNLDECRRIFDEWCEKNKETCIYDPNNCEKTACFDLFDNWDKLPVKGALIKVASRFEAFTVGELLNPDMYVIHVEKGNSDIQGIYTVINRDFCAHECTQVKYVNREEDLGIEGLRKSKNSYNPVGRVKKFLVKVSH